MSGEKNKNLTAVKTNQALIHIEHTISMVEYKLWFICLMTYRKYFELGQQKDEDGFFYLSRAELADVLGYRPKKEDLIDMMENLRLQPIRLNFFEKDGQAFDHRFRGMGFVSEWDVGDRNVGFKFPPLLEKVIEGDEQARELFVLLNWNIFNSFTGKYEGIIYKLCKDYIGVGKTPVMSVEQYRTYIGLEEHEYKQFFELNRWTIKKPLDVLNKSEISDLNIDVKFFNKGRKVEKIQFIAEYKNTNDKNMVLFDEFKPHEAFKKSKVYINPEDHSRYLSLFDSESIEKIINRANDYIESLEQKGAKKINIGAIYNKAFNEKWGLDVIPKSVGKQDDNENDSGNSGNLPNNNIKTWDSTLDQPFNVVKASFPELTKEMLIEKGGRDFDKIQVLTHKMFIRYQFYKTSKKTLPALDAFLNEIQV